MANEQKFPSEVIDLPSEGRLYPEGHPLRPGKLEIKYMTAREEDILTSENLIKKGIVIDKLLDSLILTEGVSSDDLVTGDKNAVMVAARILAYGPEYVCDVRNPSTQEIVSQTFNLADCPFKKLPKGINNNEFELKLPISKIKIKFKLLTGKDEKQIQTELEGMKKMGSSVLPELTTRLRYSIIEVDGKTEQNIINEFVNTSLLSRDSLHLRQELLRVSPDIEMKQEADLGNETVEVDIPMTVDFFWPQADR